MVSDFFADFISARLIRGECIGDISKRLNICRHAVENAHLFIERIGHPAPHEGAGKCDDGGEHFEKVGQSDYIKSYYAGQI